MISAAIISAMIRATMISATIISATIISAMITEDAYAGRPPRPTRAQLLLSLLATRRDQRHAWISPAN